MTSKDKVANSNDGCPVCGVLPADGMGGPADVCAKCLLVAGLASRCDHQSTQSFETNLRRTRFVPPTTEQVSREFPQFEILELAGVGGMGAVYKVREKELDRIVALKILPPEVASEPSFAVRFSRESRALAMLNHSNIVQVYQSGKTERYYFFLMEFVDGVNLRQTIQQGRLAPDEALAIVPQICEALQFAHKEGVVHRDIKPENILLDKSGSVKITDFGLAKILNTQEVNLTATQQVMGTAHYMAPEQMRGSNQVDHRADLYSLGVVFYELLTGELPLGRFSLPSETAQVSAKLDEVVMRTLENEPDKRYQAASDIKSDIAAANFTRDEIASPPAVLSAGTAKDSKGLKSKSEAKSFGVARLLHWVVAVLLGILAVINACLFCIEFWNLIDEFQLIQRRQVSFGKMGLLALIFGCCALFGYAARCSIRHRLKSVVIAAAILALVLSNLKSWVDSFTRIDHFLRKPINNIRYSSYWPYHRESNWWNSAFESYSVVHGVVGVLVLLLLAVATIRTLLLRRKQDKAAVLDKNLAR